MEAGERIPEVSSLQRGSDTAFAGPRCQRAADRETGEIKADPEALRALAEAREAVRSGDVVYGTAAVRRLLNQRRVS